VNWRAEIFNLSIGGYLVSYQLKHRTNQLTTVGRQPSPSITKTGEMTTRQLLTTKVEPIPEDILELSNEALLQACRRGDPLAWEALIRRYQRLVYAIPRRAGLDEDHMAEVFQRVFEKLVKYLDQIERPDRIGAWLATTAHQSVALWRPAP
jgi:hypothetical protein